MVSVGRAYGVYSTWLVLWSGHVMCSWAACGRLSMPSASAMVNIGERRQPAWSAEQSCVERVGLVCRRGSYDRYLVDPASSHMLVSKIKPCMSKYKLLHSETANGSLDQLWFLRSYNPTWITVVILELIHVTKLRPSWKERVY